MLDQSYSHGASTKPLIGETLAPTLTKFAENQKSSALGKISLINNQDGFWIRDGSNFINVEKNIDGILFNGITVIEVNKSNKIESLVKSETAKFDGSLLDMSDSRIFSIDSSNPIDDISVKERSFYNKTVSFDKDLLKSLSKELVILQLPSSPALDPVELLFLNLRQFQKQQDKPLCF